MKRPFFLMIIALLCVVSSVQGVVQKETAHTDIAIEATASGSHYIISGASDLLNHVANKEDVQPTLPRLFPTFYKFPFAGFSLELETRFNSKSEISNYVYYARCLILRLEGTDIIYPFHCFW